MQALLLTLPRPAANAPQAAWTAVVQGTLDQLAPRDPVEAMGALQIVAANAGMPDGFRQGFEPDPPAEQALRQRANAAALARILAGAARLLTEQRAQPAAAAPDRGAMAAALEAGPKLWQPYPGWENMTLAQRGACLGYRHDRPLAPRWRAARTARRRCWPTRPSRRR